MLTEMMRRSVISSPLVDSAAAALSMMRPPLLPSSSSASASSSRADELLEAIMEAPCYSSVLATPVCLAGPVRPMSLYGAPASTAAVAAGLHGRQNSTDSGLGELSVRYR